jgi:hypothetical protein
MSKFKRIKSVLGKLTLTTAAGYAASRVVSTPAEANRNSVTGAMAGFATGALAMGVPKAIKSPMAKDIGKVVFRRIRGRIIPIRKK